MSLRVRLLSVLTIGLFAVFALAFFTHPMVTSAQASFEDNKNAVCEGIGSGNCNTSKADTQKKLNDTIRNVTYLLGFIGGVIAVIMIIIGGLKYITSNGDATQATSAKNTILYAIIGLVVVIVSQVIVQFVISLFD